MNKLIALVFFLPMLALGQATAGYHRVSQVLARGTGVSALVVPYATVAVTNTGTGLAGVIYADPALTVRVPNSVVTSDANGNFGYYFNLNLCMTEKITFPNGGGFTQVNICSNGGSGGCPTSPCQISGGGTSATTATGALSNLGGLSLVQTGLQTMAGPLKVPSIITPSVSKGVVLYASAACAVNSNILSGGGADDSVCLQGIVNKLKAAGGGTLVQDGVSLISQANVSGAPAPSQTTALQIGPGVTIACTVGGGFYLANNSNVTMLGNNISGNPNANLYEQRMEVDNCTFNGNGANQSRYELGVSTNTWVYGMWFGGFNGLFLNNVAVFNARTFAFLFSNGQGFYGHDLAAVQLAGEGSGGNNHDGLHFDGTLTNIYITNFVDENGDDDALAFNTDEGVANYNSGSAVWQNQRYPSSGGLISDTTIDNVQIVGTNDALRWIGYSTPNGIAQVSNITLSNVYGTVNNFMSACCGAGVQTVGGITIDNWNASPTGGGGSTLYTPPDADPLSVSNVIWSVPVVPGGGDVQAFTPFFTIGSGGLSLYNPTYNTTPVPSLSLDNSGNMYFGFSQPQTIFRAGGINGAYLNNTGGSGYTTTWQFPSNTRLQANGIAVTANNTIDDGSGNASVAGNFFVNNTFRLTSPNSPTVSAGTVSTYSTNNGMAITGLSSATSVTITFNPSWVNYAFCTASPSVSLAAAPYVTSMSKTAATFTFPSLTGALFVVCNGN